MSAAETIAERLREEILSGSYQPGERLPAERQMAGRLGVNRASVREALRRLEELGLVETRRGGGTTVRRVDEASLEIVRHLVGAGREPSYENLAQLLDVHEMLVAGAARLAVERGSEDDLLQARELVGRLAATDGADELARLHDGILALVTRASGNIVLRLWANAVRPILREVSRSARRPPAAALAAQVRAIDAALLARDAAATEEAVRVLLRGRRERLLEALEPRSGPEPA